MRKAWTYLDGFAPRPDFALLEKFVDELERWNKAVRLVGPYDREGIAVQIADSLLPFAHAAPAFPLLDIGSGAGLPAIPLATVWPTGEIRCVEPRSKRVSFIRHAARALGLGNVTATCARAEEALTEEPLLRGHFACVTARAVADVETLLALAEPYLIENGKVILGRGGEAVPSVGGWECEYHKNYLGPTDSGERSVVVFIKSSR